MMLYSILAISVGAATGALIRWLLGITFNAFFPMLPLGTLLANLAGGYLIGITLVVFALYPAITPEWRLLIVTGFLGGLTTFSTFSAEVTTLIQQGRVGWAGVEVALHVVGSVLMTFLGLTTGLLFKRF
jgi:CrcB protein